MTITKCPECGARLQATVALYVEAHTVDVHGSRIVPTEVSLPNAEDGWAGWVDLEHQSTHVYCANDHALKDVLARVNPGPPLP